MIDTQAIRSKILDLAMRGKLTEQLPKDGTAEELYRQIQAEKQALIKADKSKKEKPLAEIAADEVPFEIPKSWKWARIGAVLKLQSGKNITASDIKNVPDDNHMIPCYGGNGQRGFVGQANTEGFHAIIGRQGALCGNINFAEGPFYATEHAVVVYGYAATNMKWAGITLRSLNLNQYATSVAQPGLAVNKIDNVPMPLPPLAEQHRIVARIEQAFSALDTIDALQAKYADNLAVLKSKLIDAAIQGKLTEQLPEDGTAEELYRQIQAEKQALIKAGKLKKEKPLPEITANEIPFEIPANWKWVRLGNIGITTTGGTPSKTHPEYYGGDYPFFKPSDLDAGRHIAKASEYLSEAGKVVSRQFQQNSILVCCIGSIGKAAIIDTDGTANQQINALTPLNSDSDYLLYAISSGAFQHQLDQESRATTVSIINKSKFDNCILPLPPFAEQKRIVAKLEELLPLCERLK